MAAPPRKLVVRLGSSFGKSQKTADHDFELLRSAVKAIEDRVDSSTGQFSLEELFSTVQSIVEAQGGGQLHALLSEEFHRWAAAECAAAAASLAHDSTAFLQRVVALWDHYSHHLDLIRQVFLYLDRAYVVSHPGTLSVFQLGLHHLRRELEALPHLHQRTLDSLLLLVEAERTGEAVNRRLLKQAVAMLSALRLYEGGARQALLASASEFYTREGAALIHELELAAYLLHCERRLAEELDRCAAYLGLGLRRPLRDTVDSCLLEAHMAAVLEGGRALLAACAEEDLARLFGMCSRVGALQGLRLVFRDYIRSAGAAVVLDEHKEEEMVPRMLRFRRDMLSVLEQSFGGHADFAQALKEGFEACLNARPDKPAELIARHLDGILRRGSKAGAAEGGLEEGLDAVLALFRYVQGKDVFEAFYKRILSRRLLMGRSASMDAEKLCISKIKAECGAQFTNQLEGMLKDIEVSADVMAGFRQHAAARSGGGGGGGVDMSVLVLTAGFWPSYRSFDCALPPELVAAQKEFADFYLSKHGGRKLTWHGASGTCLVRAHFPRGTKELQASLHQAAILLLFNGAEALPFGDIRAATGLEEAELRRTLASLCLAKEKVLAKEPSGTDIAPQDVFRVNEAYTSRLFRVKINTLQMQDSEEDSRKTSEAVLQDRFHQIDAAVVRIMKARKALSHNLLLGELAAQLRFPVGQSDVKKRIESLIDREYLQRTDLGYEYLA